MCPARAPRIRCQVEDPFGAETTQTLPPMTPSSPLAGGNSIRCQSAPAGGARAVRDRVTALNATALRRSGQRSRRVGSRATAMAFTPSPSCVLVFRREVALVTLPGAPGGKVALLVVADYLLVVAAIAAPPQPL